MQTTTNDHNLTTPRLAIDQGKPPGMKLHNIDVGKGEGQFAAVLRGATGEDDARSVGKRVSLVMQGHESAATKRSAMAGGARLARVEVDDVAARELRSVSEHGYISGESAASLRKAGEPMPQSAMEGGDKAGEAKTRQRRVTAESAGQEPDQEPGQGGEGTRRSAGEGAAANKSAGREGVTTGENLRDDAKGAEVPGRVGLPGMGGGAAINLTSAHVGVKAAGAALAQPGVIRAGESQSSDRSEGLAQNISNRKAAETARALLARLHPRPEMKEAAWVLSGELAKALKKGEIHLRTNSPTLGEVAMSIRTDATGEGTSGVPGVAVHVRCATLFAAQTLSSDASQLRAAIEKRGMKVTSLSISYARGDEVEGEESLTMGDQARWVVASLRTTTDERGMARPEWGVGASALSQRDNKDVNIAGTAIAMGSVGGGQETGEGSWCKGGPKVPHSRA